jgi:hypothetical protein
VDKSINRRTTWAAVSTVAIAMTWGGQAAHADAIVPGTPFTRTTLVSGTQTNLYEFSAPGAGTLTVRLNDMTWPERLKGLNCQLLSPTSVLGTISSGDAVNFSIGEAGNFAANVFAIAGNTLGLDLGSFSLSISYTAGAPTVPLPAAVWALFTGLGVLALARVRWSFSLGTAQPNPAA